MCSPSLAVLLYMTAGLHTGSMTISHAVCNGHLLRELTGVEQYSPGHMWAPGFKTLLRSMKKARDKAVVKGKTELSYYHLHKFDTEYDRLMMMAMRNVLFPQIR